MVILNILEFIKRLVLGMNILLHGTIWVLIIVMNILPHMLVAQVGNLGA